MGLNCCSLKIFCISIERRLPGTLYQSFPVNLIHPSFSKNFFKRPFEQTPHLTTHWLSKAFRLVVAQVMSCNRRWGFGANGCRKIGFILKHWMSFYLLLQRRFLWASMCMRKAWVCEFGSFASFFLFSREVGFCSQSKVKPITLPWGPSQVTWNWWRW